MVNPAILSVEQTRAADRMTIDAGISGFTLLSAAGRAVYAQVQKYCSPTDSVLVACGTGNNGGDGFIAASLLIDDGFSVTVALLDSPDRIGGDARQAFDALSQPTVSLFETHPNDFSVVIDALLGTGINRPVSHRLAHWFHQANESTAPVISVDIPSGISGDSGAVLGSAIEAEHTVTFYSKKPGHVLYPGRHHCGTVHVCDIGFAPSILDTLQPTLFENDPTLWRAAIPNTDWAVHKYTKGHAVVVTGAAHKTGAARLAARAALRAGAGLVTLACPTASTPTVAAHVTCEMIQRIDTPDELERMLEDKRITSIVLGPGLGKGKPTRAMIEIALASSASVVLDADGLTSYEDRLDEFVKLTRKAKASVVLTPHWGEFCRLFGEYFQSIKNTVKTLAHESWSDNKLRIARAAAEHCNAIVVLKGPDTVIAQNSGSCVVNTNAPPWLATAGSGDVLAGTVAGWLAQGVAGLDAACIGCWMHGQAATLIGPGLIATDIVEQYPTLHQQLVR